MDLPILSIVIPTLGDSRKLLTLLNSIQIQKMDSAIEVIIIDNSLRPQSDLHLHACLSSFRFPIKYIQSERIGVNGARNLGLKVSASGMILFIDDDCWLRDLFLLKKHIAFHQENPDVFAIGGQYHLPIEKSALDRCYHEIQMRWLQAGIKANDQFSQYLIGGHFSIKKQWAVDSDITFNEAITYGGSELSFFKKAHDLGFKLLLKNIYIMHDTNETFLTLSRKLYRQGIGKAITAEATLQVQNPDINFEGAAKSILSVYLNFIFWFGYHRHNRDYMGFLRYVVVNVKLSVQQRRQKWLQRLDGNLQNKKDRGDLL